MYVVVQVYVYANTLYIMYLHCVILIIRSLHQLQVPAVETVTIVTVTVVTVTAVAWLVTQIDHVSSMSRTYSSA
jgi:hypothetical protein